MRRASLTACTPGRQHATGQPRDAAMASGRAERFDFFLSRWGSVATIAREVTDVLKEKGNKVRTWVLNVSLKHGSSQLSLSRPPGPPGFLSTLSCTDFHLAVS
jgi:hypothetical protein